jgi:GT2 family glycosyltransferase
MPRVTIGIPACDDDPAVVAAALAALAGERDAEVLVVDMSRGDAIAAVVRRAARVRYVPFPESRGISDSRNRIIALARARHVLFLDADAVPRPGWAAALVRTLEEGHTLAGARIVPHWARRPSPLIDSALARELLGNLDCGDDPRLLLPRVMGTSFGLDRERIPSLEAPFDPALGHRPGHLLGQEEVQFSLTVLAAGGTIGYAPGAVVDHHIRAGRGTWPWMARRIVREGRNRQAALEPFPRALGVRDRAFQLVTAPLFVAGRLQGRLA